MLFTVFCVLCMFVCLQMTGMFFAKGTSRSSDRSLRLGSPRGPKEQTEPEMRLVADCSDHLLFLRLSGIELPALALCQILWL